MSASLRIPRLRNHASALAPPIGCMIALAVSTAWADPPVESAAKPAAVKASDSDRAQNRRVLSEFGRCGTDAEASATLKKALKALVDQGGGILVIPRDAPEGWYPRNCLQAEYRAPGVTVVDARGGVERLFVPPLGAGASDGVRGGNLMIERDASLNAEYFF